MYGHAFTGAPAPLTCGIDECTENPRVFLEAVAASGTAADANSGGTTFILSQVPTPEWYDLGEKLTAMAHTKTLEIHRKGASKPGQGAGAAGLDGNPQGCKRSPTEHYDRAIRSLLGIGQGAAPSSERRSKMADMGNKTGDSGDGQVGPWDPLLAVIDRLTNAAALDSALAWEAAQQHAACQPQEASMK